MLKQDQNGIEDIQKTDASLAEEFKVVSGPSVSRIDSHLEDFEWMAWLLDSSDGSYYDTTAYVDHGFSGGSISEIDKRHHQDLF